MTRNTRMAIVFFGVAQISAGCARIPKGDLYPLRYETRGRLAIIGLTMQRAAQKGVDISSAKSYAELCQVLHAKQAMPADHDIALMSTDAWGRPWNWSGDAQSVELRSLGTNGVVDDDDIILRFRLDTNEYALEMTDP